MSILLGAIEPDIYKIYKHIESVTKTMYAYRKNMLADLTKVCDKNLSNFFLLEYFLLSKLVP